MTPTPIIEPTQTGEASALKVGGASALLLAALYVVIIVLYARVGAPPSGGEAWLAYLQGKTTVWWTILYLSVLTDVLFLPVALALYLALREHGRHAMVFAVACMGLFVALDLSVTWTDYATLLTLSDRFGAAATDAQRAAYIAAADAASAVLGSKLEVIYAIVDLSLGILLAGWVMLKGAFGRIPASLGIATGVLGLASLSGAAVAIISNAVFATLWLIFAGVRLWRLGCRPTRPSS